jgi:hypothetical protein
VRDVRPRDRRHLQRRRGRALIAPAHRLRRSTASATIASPRRAGRDSTSRRER